VLRSPPPGWIDTLCSKHANCGGKKDGSVNSATLAELAKTARLIKVPDVYEVEMKFTSLLPQNFNNYLFTYSQNNTMETEYASGSIYQEGAFATVIKAATTDFIADMKEYIQNMDSATPQTAQNQNQQVSDSPATNNGGDVITP
jgi:hypothetical protein